MGSLIVVVMFVLVVLVAVAVIRVLRILVTDYDHSNHEFAYNQRQKSDNNYASSSGW